MAGVAAVTDHFTRAHGLALHHCKPIQVGVHGFQPLAVGKLDHVAIAVGIAAGHGAVPLVHGAHRSGSRRVHRGAHGRLKVDRAVQAAVAVKPSGSEHMPGQRPGKAARSCAAGFCMKLHICASFFSP